MRRTLLRAKIDRARVTRCDLDYEGSLTLPRDLMDRAGLIPYEQVDVLNRNNGSRVTTYLIPGAAGSGEICLNGPAARCGIPGDEIIILAYGLLEPSELAGHEPVILCLGGSNRVPAPPRARASRNGRKG